MKSRKTSKDLDMSKYTVGARTTAIPIEDLTSQITEPSRIRSLVRLPRSVSSSRERRTAREKKTRGVIAHINDFGLCTVTTEENTRVVFMLDKLSGYSGQPLRDLGLRAGTKVVLRHDASGRVSSVQIANAVPARS